MEPSQKMQYLAVLMMLGVAISFAAFNLVMSWILGEKAGTNPLKDSAYECGMPVLSPARTRFSVKFYVIAVLFILFDIEVVFMYPWAISFQRLGWFGFFEMLTFLTILFAGWIYVYSKGALDWER